MLYVFLGAREPRIHDEARIALGLADAEDLSLTRLDGADTSLVAVAEACGAIDMFGGRRKVLLSNAQALVASNKKGLAGRVCGRRLRRAVRSRGAGLSGPGRSPQPLARPGVHEARGRWSASAAGASAG